MTSVKATEFLERVANDPAYRRELQADPVGTLAKLGITVDQKDLPLGAITLPSPQDILDHLDQWTEKLDDSQFFMIWKLH